MNILYSLYKARRVTECLIYLLTNISFEAFFGVSIPQSYAIYSPKYPD